MSVKNSEGKAPITREQFVAALRSQLKFHDILGIGDYPANSGLQRFFDLTESNMGALNGMSLPSRKDDSDSHSKDREVQDTENRLFLNREIAGCSLCHLSDEKLGSVFGDGNPSSSLMIVGDWSQQEKENFSQKIFFGPDEDVMLWKMMAAIDLKPEDIYVTNCLKCCPGGKTPPDSLSEKSCFSFLGREIALTRPGIICAMGEVAARMLTGSTEPLARQRGKFVRYRYQSDHGIFVIPTYHPRFLLQNREMKKATWLDLQAIKKRLSP